MKRYVTNDILEIAKDHIITNKKFKITREYTKHANCYTYALNIDLPIYTNIGDICDRYDFNYGLDDFESLFIDDCKKIDIDVEKVSPDYELSEENEWLVALYGTDYFIRDGDRKSDFHFIKKNYNSIWSSKLMGERPSNKDDRGIKFKDASNATFAIYDDDKNVIFYNYIGTYKLTRR